MIGIVDRNAKEVRIFCVLNDRSKKNLMPIICKNVNTNINENMQIDDIQNEEIYSTKTRICSDCWASYQDNDFKEYGYILK